jgi:hypothetical protein
MGQGSEPVSDKVEYLVKSSDGEDTLCGRSDTAEDQLVSTIPQQLPQFEQSRERCAARNVNAGKINDHVTVTPFAHHFHDSLQLIVLL